MAVLLNGTNGLIQAYDYQTPSTGFSYTFAAGTQTLVMNPAATLAAGTITMPAAPSDGMTITFSSTQQITALTLSGNTGQTVVGAPTQLIANQPLSFIYRSTNTTWYAMAGGAGRATQVVSGTTVATTSGTAIDITGIPSWAKRVTIMLTGVSTNGTNDYWLQVGSGSFSTSGYVYLYGLIYGTNVCTTGTPTSAFTFNNVNTASDAVSGIITLTLQTGNTWVVSVVTSNNNGRSLNGAGYIALGGSLDRVRITSNGGTNTFDAGSINITYE